MMLTLENIRKYQLQASNSLQQIPNNQNSKFQSYQILVLSHLVIAI